MIKAGVIDPAKVTRLALQNAASIVCAMLTTEVLIADMRDNQRRRAPVQALAAWAACIELRAASSGRIDLERHRREEILSFSGVGSLVHDPNGF